jgi:hypothetical protein
VQALSGGKVTGASVIRAEMLHEYRQALQSTGWRVQSNAFSVDARLVLHFTMNGHNLTPTAGEGATARRERGVLDTGLVFRCSNCRRTAGLADLRAATCAPVNSAPMQPPTGSSGPRGHETTLDRITRLTQCVNAMPVATHLLYRVHHTSHGPSPDTMVVPLTERLPGDRVKAFAAGLIALGYYTAVERSENHHAPRLIAIRPGRRDAVDFIPVAPC